MKNLFFACFLSMFTMTAFASPQIIAHRGGTGDAPENTIYAIDKALHNKAGAVWVTLQLSKDNQVVLYRPSDLKSLTNKTGPVSAFSAAELAKTDAAHRYNLDNNTAVKATIPTLDTVLARYPDTYFYLDIKSPDADPARFSEQLERVLTNHNALQRTRVYSTNDAFLSALPPGIAKFESRDATRTALANTLLTHTCDAIPAAGAAAEKRWYGFELHRKVEVVEKFTLGEGRSPAVLTWDKYTMDCFRQNNRSGIILFGVNSPADLKLATDLGADGIMADSLIALSQHIAG